MNIQDWKIFDKKGSQLNWSPDPLIHISFNSPTGKGASAFFVTDVSGKICGSEITSGGYLYDNNTTVSYNYSLEEGTTDITNDSSVVYVDVLIFNPDAITTKSISDVILDASLVDSLTFTYPSVTYASAIFMKPISVGLVETEHLFIFEEPSIGSYIRPHDASNSILVFELVGDDKEIAFFEVNEDTQEITWTDSLVYDTSLYEIDTPITLNIGFRSEFEGVFERILRIYHLVGDTLYTLAEIVVNAEAIGEDERFRTLISNFGLHDPKDMKDVFKETDINEDLPDWEVLNYKSKHIILEHDQIMPYIGTYKALINAIKWLGYDDVFVREWFLNVRENRKLSLLVPFNATDRTQTILSFNEDQRKTLKKLNQLSLNYCITRETGEIDEWGTPETENCYSYNLKEVFIKLLSLKQWLEKNIIAVNCRITDITGEGIYFERIQNLIYATDNVGYDLQLSQSLTPYSPDDQSELVSGDASIRLTFLELTQTKLSDFNCRFIDLAQSAWNPNDPSAYYTDPCTGQLIVNYVSLDDPSFLVDPSSYLLIGATVQYPSLNISDIMYKLSVEKTDAGVIGSNLVTNPLFILENDLRFYNIFDSSSIFYDVSTNLTLLLENAILRDPSIDDWYDSIAYRIYPNPSENGYILKSSTGEILAFDDYVTLLPDVSAKLQYAYDDNYNVPLLSMQYFSFTDSSLIRGNFGDKSYFIDIIDGKIAMKAGTVSNASENVTMYINWNYDTSLSEQKITVNSVYETPRIQLFQIDPSVYYWADPSGLTGGDNPSTYISDNKIYTAHVNHTGEYNLELFAFDSYNTIYHNVVKELFPVFIKAPTFYTLIDNCCNISCVSTFMTLNEVSTLINNNSFPIYDRYTPLQGISLNTNIDGVPYISVPSITYFQDVPAPDSRNIFYNLTERVLTISGTTLTVDEDYQTFNTGDNVNIVKFDSGKYALIEEVSSYIISADNSSPNMIVLDQIPTSFIAPDQSTNIYILNDTHRSTSNIINNAQLSLDVSNYVFEPGQLVGIIVTDINKPEYEWGASYRVSTVNGYTHTFDNILPHEFLDTSTYTVKVKHAFSTYANLSIPTSSATEVNNTFSIYLKNSYCQEYYLDNTFVLLNVLFEQEPVNDQWYNASDNLINSEYYYHPESITVDVSTLVILRAIYDPSIYLLNQKNIWQLIEHDSSTIVFKVFNDSVPYIFNEAGRYDVECTSYDSFGNAIYKKYEGLINVV